MADAPKSPPRGDKNKPAAGVQFSERSLDLDVRSSSGPYPRPRPPRGKLKKTWLAVAGAAVILGLTWVLFSSDDGPAPPAPPAPAAALSGSADRSETLDFAPVPDQSEDKPASPQELTEAPPAQPAAPTVPVKATPPAQAIPPVQPADTPAQAQTVAPATPAKATPAATPVKPADPPAAPVKATPVQAAEPVQAEPPVQATEQPASPVEKPAEISEKWVVNVSSTPDAAESLRFLSALMGQDVGGKVYASEAVLEGRVQHRIRVGFFDTKEEAEAVGQKIKERFRLYATPWAVRPSQEEENKYGDGR